MAGEQLETVASALRAVRFNFQDEEQLQRGIAQVLAARGFAFDREVRLTPTDRIDFLVGAVGIEVKIDGGLGPLTRQLHRYSEHPRIGALLLVTSRLAYARQPEAMSGKPLAVVVIR